MSDGLIIGSRGSRLALVQAETVADALRKAHPHLEVSIKKIVTEGDRDQRTRLDHMEGMGVFVKELEEALLDGRIDLAVHSLKDVPTELPPGLCLAASPPRLDPADVLVSRGQRLAELPAGSRIGTGSLRRAAQVAACRADLEVCSTRGNVDTRLRRVSSGELDGVILAAAALTRLGWEDRISQRLPLDTFLPAVGQGALVIETRLGDAEIAPLLSPLNHLPTWQGITAERAFLRGLGGGCRAPIAALGTVSGGRLKLAGMVADASGHRMIHASDEGSATAAEELGIKLAQQVLDMGAAEFIDEVGRR